jgi:hypothetical protein
MSDETGLEMVTKVEVIRQEVAPVVARAGALVVASPEQYEGAAEFLKTVKAAQKRVVDFFAPIKAAAHAAWKRTTAGEAELLDPLQEAEMLLKRKMVGYAQAEEAKREAEQRRLQAAADEAARKERERLEREAAKLKTPELREARLEQAAMVSAPVVSVASVRPVVAGQSLRTIWRARIVDPAKVPREWLVPNVEGLNAFARATKGACVVPGVEMYSEQSLSSGSK